MCTNDVAMRSHQRRDAASSSSSHLQAAQRLGCPSETPAGESSILGQLKKVRQSQWRKCRVASP
jgi:hypothetical protein